MTIGADEAAAMLADVETVVARVKQSRVYRNAALIIILWGAVDLVRDLLICGVAAHGSLRDGFWRTPSASWARSRCCVSARRPPAASRCDSCRFRAASTPSAGSGRSCWVNSGREEMAFWPTLFLFGYTLIGLWFGAAFSAIGLGLTALILAGYLWSGEAFLLWQAVVTGFGFMLCGLWMRRA